MSDVLTTVGTVLAGKADLKELKKKMEKSLIQSISAPSKKRKRKKIVSTYDEQIDKVGSEGKSATTAIINQLDTSIKGQGRKAIESTIEQHKNDYDEL